MNGGGSLFWKFFTEKVADEVAKHKFARLIADLKTLDVNTKIYSCSSCFLPTDNIQCEFCMEAYCDRSYYCENKDKIGLISNSCDICDKCHKCDICGEIMSFYNCGHDIKATGKFIRRCGHVYCIIHEDEGEAKKYPYKCLICETEQN